MLRHYEKAGLMSVHRSEKNYRHYSEADLRRAGRIRDFIATGFSTREIRAMVECLSDEGAGRPCTAGIAQLTEKLEHIDRLRDELDARREAVFDRIAALEKALPPQPASDDPHQPVPSSAVTDSFSEDIRHNATQ